MYLDPIYFPIPSLPPPITPNKTKYKNKQKIYKREKFKIVSWKVHGHTVSFHGRQLLTLSYNL